VIEYIESTIESEPIEATDAQKSMLLSRRPSIRQIRRSG